MFKLKPILVFTQKFHEEGPEGVKWELGLAGFTLGKWGSSHTGTGIWSLGMGKKWEWDSRIAKWDLEKKMNWEMDRYPPCRILHEF